jgi:tetratricopeptide (TPR) repeat protein
MKNFYFLFTVLFISHLLFAQDIKISKEANDKAKENLERKRQEILHCKGLNKDSIVHIYDRFLDKLMANLKDSNIKVSYTNLEYIVSNNHQGELEEHIGDLQNLLVYVNEISNTLSTNAELANVSESYANASKFYGIIADNRENYKYILKDGTTLESYYFWKCKFDFARLSFKQKKYRDAWVNYNIASEYYLPDSSNYLAAVAMIKDIETKPLNEQGSWNKRILEFFGNALQVKPDNKLYIGERAKFYLHNLKDSVNGLADLNKAASLQSTDPEIYYQLALISHSKMHNDQEAMRNLSICIKLEAEKADYYYLRAILYRDSKNYSAALNDFKNAIKYGKANPDYYAGKGFCNGQLDNFIETYDDYNVALLLNPKDEISRNNVQKLDPVLKAEYVKKGVNAQNVFQYFMKQGNDFLKNDDKLYAALSFTKCTKIEPTNAEPYNKAGKLFGYYKMNNYAEPYLHYAAYSNGKNAEYFVDLGLFYVKNLEEYKKASGILDTAALLGSKNELGYYYNGLCKQYAMANVKGALNDYSIAIQLKPDFKEVILIRGDLLMNEFKNYSAALADYEVLKKLDPKNDIYFHKIKECKEKMKK